MLSLIPQPGLPPDPKYSLEEEQEGTKLGGRKDKNGWIILPDTRRYLPQGVLRGIVQDIHTSTYLGQNKLEQLIRKYYLGPHLREITHSIISRCRACAKVNAQNKKLPCFVKYRGKTPGELWEVDFTEMSRGKSGYKYLLVLVDTYSGWVEAFPTRGETAPIVCKILMREIIARYGITLAIGSDNGPAFVSKVSQELAARLGINWKLHCIYRPQSSGQVERMTRTLKETLIKLKEETGENWVELLPFALFCVRCTPYIKTWAPFEILFGQPIPLVPHLTKEEIEVSNHNFLRPLQALQKIQNEVHAFWQAQHREGGSETPESPEPGQWVWILNLRKENLEPRWIGPFQVLLSTPTAVWVAEKPYWIHLSHTKTARAPEEKSQGWRVQQDQDKPLKPTFSRA